MAVALQHPREAAAPIDTSTQIETPEHIRFELPLAGPTRRILAYLIDLVIRVAILAVVGLVVALADTAAGLDGVSTGFVLLLYFGLDWFYFVLFETLWSGRSPGKRALRLRVVGQDGRSLTVLDSILRNLLRAADFLPFGYAVGLVIMGGDPLFRRFGDMVAGTIVVVEEPRALGARLELHPRPSADELAELPLHPQVSRVELEAIELLLRRRGTLAPLREVELAEMIVPLLARRLGVEASSPARRDPVRFLALVYVRARGELET